MTDYGGVDVYVEPDEDSFEFPHEECFLHLEDELGAGYNDDYVECSFSKQQEKDGPPKLTDEELAQLDRDASLEELVRLTNMGVISEYGNKTGEEMVLDTRLVFDWRFRDERWKRRARLVAREFRSGDASNEETFSPTSRKWIIHMFLVLALVQQLNVLLMDVKDAFLTVPRRDLVIIEIPTWAKSNDMAANGVDFWKLVRCLPGQRKAALHWRHEHFESTVSKFDFIPFEGMVTVYKHKVKCMYITIHVDDLLIIGAQDECEWFKAEISQCFPVKSEGPYSLDERWECQYLKRTLISNETGIVIPNKKYIPKLLELLKMENRRGKSLPHHAQLESY